MVKIISDELITQINDQLRASVNEMIKRELTDYLQNIDWSQEIDFGDELQTMIHDEIRNMDLIGDFRDDISEIVNEELDSILSDLVISRG